MTSRILRFGLVLAGLSSGAAASGQSVPSKAPSLVISSMYGRDLFEFYCASCHGRDGRGDGPVASILTSRPADLTTIAQRNGGVFPADRVEALVSGSPARSVTAHGPSEMPVWGPIFRALDANDTANRLRIRNLVGYLESLQQARDDRTR